jgi:hypothetical protein
MDRVFSATEMQHKCVTALHIQSTVSYFRAELIYVADVTPLFCEANLSFCWQHSKAALPVKLSSLFERPRPEWRKKL